MCDLSLIEQQYKKRIELILVGGQRIEQLPISSIYP